MSINGNKNKKIDMTSGPIMQKVLLFAVPIVIGNILQQLYSTVDTLIIGRYCESTSLAAVGTSSQPVEVLLCLFMGIGSAVSIMASQYAGQGDYSEMKRLCSTGISFVYIVGIPLTIAGWFCAGYILKFMGVPTDTWAEALSYTRIVFLGTMANIGYNMNAGVLRGIGDSRASLIFLIISCLVNVALDFLFVAGIGLGVPGAAIATTIAMVVSWISSVIYAMVRYPELGFTILPHRCYGDMMKKMLSLGLPIGLNHSLYSFGHLALQTFVNAQGSIFMAGVSVACKVTGIANVAITALSSAGSTFSGQNYGAKNYERLKKGYWLIPLVSGGITLFFAIIVVALRLPILHWFSDDSEVVFYASRYVICILASQWLYAIFNGIINIVNGTGRVKYTMAMNLTMLWAIRIPSAFIISRFFDGTWVMLCYPISFTFGFIAMCGYYLFCPSWKKLINTKNAQ